jgi:hypothetical protein
MRHRFCRRHSSWFCPCVAAWLYSARERAAYLEPPKPARERPKPDPHAFEEEQLALSAQDEETPR